MVAAFSSQHGVSVSRLEIGTDWMRVLARWCRWQVLVATVWLSVIGIFFASLFTYASTTGPAGNPPPLWPASTTIAHSQNGKTLVMFAHPRCPCTRASLQELDAVVASHPEFDRLQVVFFRPNVHDGSWSDTDIVHQACAMSRVDVSWDDGGRLASQFGAQTSGHVLIYDDQGQLAFSGGITALRGHEGWNTGRAAAVAVGRGESPKVSQTPIFGCPLIGPCVSSSAASLRKLP